MLLLQTLLAQAGFPAFPLDTYGFPELGSVIKYFRKKMVYTDIDGCERRWTQRDLANALGLSEDMVGLMETKNEVEDSISRRRALADILKIPPVLLGIGTLADLETFLKTHALAQHQGSSSASKINDDDVRLYQDALILHWSMYYAGSVQSVGVIQHWANRIGSTIRAHPHTPAQLEALLCSYYQLIADASGEHCAYKVAFQYLDDALEIASAQNNLQLQAAVYYRTAAMRLNQRKFALAKAPADMAVSLAQHADPSLQGAIYQTAGLTYALTAQDEPERTRALKLLDQAGDIANDEDRLGEDVHHVRFNPGRYRLERADALITLGRPNAALKQLDEADALIPFDQRRRRGYVHILRAEAHMQKKNPQLDFATDYLQNAFEDSAAIHSDYNIGYVARLCQALSQSNYGTSPVLGRLKRSLREYQKR
jgi:transcriptional regulator with XRE-family HTH domain